MLTCYLISFFKSFRITLISLVMAATLAVPFRVDATPYNYSISGDLSIGMIGDQVSDLVGLLAPDPFGPWSGTLTYDGANPVFVNDIISNIPSPTVVGRVYEIQGNFLLTLADSTSLSGGLGQMAVFTHPTFLGGPRYTLSFGSRIPDSFWVGGIPPAECPSGGGTCWNSYLSILAFSVTGIPTNELPPTDLSAAFTGGGGLGRICADRNQNGLIDINRECVFLNSSTNELSTAPIPVPATMLLFGTGLAGLAGTRLRRKKK